MALRYCEVCSTEKDELYMTFVNGNYFCSTLCASSYYTIHTINLVSSAGIISIPPPGKFKVTNFYISDGKLTVEYDDTPTE